MANVNHSVVFPSHFERAYFFDQEQVHSTTNYMTKHWTNSIVYSVIYIVVIFALQNYMKDKKPLELRRPLAIWSAILAVFSILGSIRMVPELIIIIRNYGLTNSACTAYFDKGVSAFWMFLLTMSKVYELGDTLFIVLRKQKLIFLHWYHHSTVLIYCWYSYPDHTAPARWFVTMNYCVHAAMYTYYTCKVMKFSIPRPVNIVITSMQLSQMVIGGIINCWSYRLKTRGEFCQQSYSNIKFGLLMYLSYFILFGHFFYKAYIRNGRVRQEEIKRKAQ